MLRKIIFYLSFLFIFFELGGSEGLHTMESAELYEKADLRWNEFENELKWYLSTFPTKNERLGKALEEARAEFLQFRDKIGELFYSTAEGSYAKSLHALVMLDTTNWYTRYLEKKLFPHDWQQDYQRPKRE